MQADSLPAELPEKPTGMVTDDLFGDGSLKDEGESESRSVVSNSLRPHGVDSPWNSPGQNTGVGSFSLLQGISSQPRDRTQVSRIAGRRFNL